MKLRYLHHEVELGGSAELAPGAAIIGRLRAGDGLVLRAFATLRADGESITVGRNGWFGERASVHIVDGILGTTIGDDITVGRFGLVHACTMGNGCVVGEGAAVLDGASVGDGAVIAAGSVVTPRKSLAGWLAVCRRAREAGARDRLAPKPMRSPRPFARGAPRALLAARSPAAARHGHVHPAGRARTGRSTPGRPRSRARGRQLRRAHGGAGRRRCAGRRRGRVFRLCARRARRAHRHRRAHQHPGQFRSDGRLPRAATCRSATASPSATTSSSVRAPSATMR